MVLDIRGLSSDKPFTLKTVLRNDAVLEVSASDPNVRFFTLALELARKAHEDDRTFKARCNARLPCGNQCQMQPMTQSIDWCERHKDQHRLLYEERLRDPSRQAMDSRSVPFTPNAEARMWAYNTIQEMIALRLLITWRLFRGYENEGHDDCVIIWARNRGDLDRTMALRGDGISGRRTASSYLVEFIAAAEERERNHTLKWNGSERVTIDIESVRLMRRLIVEATRSASRGPPLLAELFSDKQKSTYEFDQVLARIKEQPGGDLTRPYVPPPEATEEEKARTKWEDQNFWTDNMTDEQGWAIMESRRGDIEW